MHKRCERAFTLIELLVTLAILGVVATLIIPMAQLSMQRTREQELRRALVDIRHALDAFKRASDEGRIVKKSGSSGYPETLRILVDGVIDQRDPKRHKIFFMRRIPRDPMQIDRSMDEEASWSKRCYASEASDPQEGEDVYDVYSSSSVIGLNAVPYRQW